MLRVGATLTVTFLALAGCGSETTLPEPPPAGVVENLRATEAVELDAQLIAADAVDQEQLSSLLGRAGFESAVERRYAGPGGAIRRVEVRVVRFDSIEGAGQYLAWLQEHVEDVIGEATLVPPAESPTASVYVHVPDGCCPKETGLALASWRDGRDVLRVLVAGPAADGRAGLDLIASVRQEIASA